MALAPLPYHLSVTDILEKQTNVWKHFSKQKVKDDAVKSFKNELLKNTLRYSEEAEPELYAILNKCREKLGLDINVTLYHELNNTEINASIVKLGDEAHLVFSGKILSLLDKEEKAAVIAHELSHSLLYSNYKKVETANSMVNMLGNNFRATAGHYETARLFKLYTEIYCDRGAYIVNENYNAIISSLVKMDTGLENVNADDYIKQAHEIFATDNKTKTAGITHPENFIRARALHLWHTNKETADDLIKEMIEGIATIDQLDLFAQQQITEITHDLILIILAPKWIQDEKNLQLAREYFKDFEPGKQTINTQNFKDRIQKLHDTVKDYLAQVMYDFAVVNQGDMDINTGYLLTLSSEFDLQNQLETIVKKEQKLTAKKYQAVKKAATEAYLNELKKGNA
ncbi:M48 family metalloprotease [Polluticaenibacter yanchengensis]|uniref:M48 family metalloprotease n=1 Tax=Polluticaenibacter yanchengensis TaxID=3014562 RepID=A0ABT4UM41_9BACT|nr:M48 family metalloprotease [Chitinophagaceae bacterium LY-5]